MPPRSKDTLHANGGLLSYAQTPVSLPHGDGWCGDADANRFRQLAYARRAARRPGLSTLNMVDGPTARRIAWSSTSSATKCWLRTNIMTLEEAEPDADQCGEESQIPPPPLCPFSLLFPPSLRNTAISIYIVKLNYCLVGLVRQTSSIPAILDIWGPWMRHCPEQMIQRIVRPI